jgi:hypothetical protein
MNKILIRSLLLFIIVGLFFLILFLNRSPFGKSNSSFASEPKEDITRIELSAEGKKLVLEKKGEAWLINGKSEARKSGVLFLIRILKELKIKSPVSGELFLNEVRGKNVSPVKVKVYENRKLLKTILVYKTHSNIYGNIMKIRDSSKPFIVYVPGYEGDIGSAFIMNELFWQPYTVFNLLPSEISMVKLDNLSDTASSFTIIKKNNHFVLSGFQGLGSGFDTSRVVRYISYFAFIPFESWAFDIAGNRRDSVESSRPLYRISVNTTSGKSKILTLWGMQVMKNGKKETDSDRLIGKTGDKDDLFIMRYFDIDPLLKRRSYFFRNN